MNEIFRLFPEIFANIGESKRSRESELSVICYDGEVSVVNLLQQRKKNLCHVVQRHDHMAE